MSYDYPGKAANLGDEVVKAPWDAVYSIHGSFYKTGSFGMVFRHNGSEWVKSTKEPDDLKKYKTIRERGNNDF